MRVWAEQQLGEITGGNNWVQENIFQFEAPAHSIPETIIMPVAVRNPLKKRTIVLMSVKGVAKGFKVHFPHTWLWLDPLEERKFELIVIPIYDYNWYRDRKVPYADVRLEGYVPHSYQEEILPGVLPGSKMLAIGGITAKVIPKRGVDIKLEEDKERSTNKTIALIGELAPTISGQKLRVELRDPNDQMKFIEAISDIQGQFRALFDLTVKPSFEVNSDNGHTKQARQKLQPGIYKAQALVIDSPNAAEAESNIVYITKT